MSNTVHLALFLITPSISANLVPLIVRTVSLHHYVMTASQDTLYISLNALSIVLALFILHHNNTLLKNVAPVLRTAKNALHQPNVFLVSRLTLL